VRIRRPRHLTLALALAFASGCGLASPSPISDFGDRLRSALSPDAIRADLSALERIADANNGVRADGTPGYDASVAYVVDELRKSGYSPTLQKVMIPYFRQLGPGTLQVAGGNGTGFSGERDFRAALFSPSGDVTATVAAIGFDKSVDPTAFAEHPIGKGCAPDDFPATVRGAVALVLAGPCLRRTQVDRAQAAGAAALVVVYPQWQAGDLLRPTLLRPEGLTIPVVVATMAVGIALAGAAASNTPVHLAMRTSIVPHEVANVLAETPGGDPNRVLVLGGHLDSAGDGPGINDNGSGTMTILEVARRMAALPMPRWKLRFAFWAGEELGLYGSSAYLRALSDGERSKIAAYLNFDMLASMSGGRLIYDDGAAAPGSKSISALFETAFNEDGLSSERLDLSGGSDHYPFEQAGIPTGGLFAGANEPKAPADVQRFGGLPGQVFDACYHKACDRLERINANLLAEMVRAVGFATGQLAGGAVDLSR
jgi:Zn-dependent M28 family amino/carboxypeptidase